MESGGDGHWPVLRGERAGIYRDCFVADVVPVHERTEFSRRTRVEYAQFALKALIALNAGALLALPAIGWLIGISLAERTGPLLFSLGLFFAGLCVAMLIVFLAYITLDADVVRQKAERFAARARIVEAEFPQSFSPEMSAMLERTMATEKRFWSIGVSLAWTAAALAFVSFALFVAGGLAAVPVLR